MKILGTILWGALAALPALCVETKFWQQTDLADFEKGKMERISVRSDGLMTLAPATRELLDAGSPYLWAVARDSKGTVYTGGSGPGATTSKLFAIDPQGRSKTVAELDGLAIQALAVDAQDRVYAATNPDGKVYRIVNGKPEVFFDPRTKYIWALAFARGDLFVATGDRGEIFRVTPDGKGSLFFATEETHARSLAVDREGNLIAGTEPGGLVLRITPQGAGFVLYQMAKREVTAVAVAPDGSVYAAAVGNPPSASSSSSSSSSSTENAPPPPPPATAPGGTQITVTPARPAGPPPATSSRAAVTGGSEVYRMLPDGYPRKVWSHAQEIVYAIAFDSDGRPVIGTGNKGNVYRLDSDLRYTLLVNFAPTQVTGFAAGRNGEILAATGNIGKLIQIGPGLEKQGTFESEPFDSGAFSYWGRVTTGGEDQGGRTTTAIRSGNVGQAGKNWSPWTAVADGRAAVPAARFLQYRLTLEAGAGGKSPEVSSVETAYLAKNVAPVIREVEITPANYRFPAGSAIVASSSALTLSLPSMGQKKTVSSAAASDTTSTPTMTYAKGSIGVRWRAQDDNGDTLAYKVEIRGWNETSWKLLRDKVREKYLSWDSTAFPDGKYVLRITASDAPSNPPDQSLEASLESYPFYIDNTPPQITGLSARASGGKVTVQWKAKDALSVIEKAEYSVNGGDWTVVEPSTRLSDSPELDYRLTLDRAGTAEVTIAVRVTDEYENQSVDKVVVR